MESSIKLVAAAAILFWICSANAAPVSTRASDPVLGDLSLESDNILNQRRKLTDSCKKIIYASLFCQHTILFVSLFFTVSDVPLHNCKELYDYGFRKTGLYLVNPSDNGGEFVVFCDMSLVGGGWTVIQRRVNESLAFNRSWGSYKNGFGDYAANFWLGLEKIKRLTNGNGNMELYVGLQTFLRLRTYSARYGLFNLEGDRYTLHIGRYYRNSTVRDSFSIHDGESFSTFDADHDSHQHVNCAKRSNGGWWYHKDCHDSNLNGVYYRGGRVLQSRTDGINWAHLTGDEISLKTVVMAIRPAQ